jgi:hypothetical protein
MKAHLQEAVFGIVLFAASPTGHVAAPGGAALVVVFGDGESCAAAAGDEEHAEGCFGSGLGLRISFYGPMFHDKRNFLSES